MHNIYRKNVLTVSLTAALITGAMIVAPLAQAASVAHATSLRQGDVVTGALPLSQSLHVVVALKLRNEAQLDAAIAQRQIMSQQQFMADHAPTAAQAQSVADYLRQSGFHNVTIAPNRLLVSGSAPAGMVERAFHTQMVAVRTHDGRAAFANSTDVSVPASLQGVVQSVLGLQTVHMLHTFARPMPTGSASTYAVTGHNPVEFASIYGGSGVPTAAGVTVGIVTNGNLDSTISDLNTFTSNKGLPTVTTQIVDTDGTSHDTTGTSEWDLDSQDNVGMAGGEVGTIIYYNMPSLYNTDLVDNFNTVVTRNEAKIINVSLGECETSAQGDGSAAAADSIFKQAAAQGQTFSISTGDSGADECGDGGITPSWPANSQYVVAAGGTTLNASSTTWNGETVWSGTGGSASLYEPMPSWQVGVGQNAGHSTRGLPDIAYDADPNSGAQIIVKGRLQQWGGTSLSAPLFAGFWARMIAAKGTSIGFAAPQLYQLAASDFHDVTSGNNGGETAAPGWDYTTGFGSIIMNQALSSLGGGGGGGGTGNSPPTASFSDSVSGLTVTFTNTSTDSDGSIASSSWNFGDGSTSTATSPSHTYAAYGTYTVTLTVTDDGGASSTTSHSVKLSKHGNGNGGGGGGHGHNTH
jgi:xanthomonalisin